MLRHRTYETFMNAFNIASDEEKNLEQINLLVLNVNIADELIIRVMTVIE